MGRVDALVNMLLQGRLGFAMDEIMTGTHSFLPGKGPEGIFPLEFVVTWGSKHIERFINPLHPECLRAHLEGTITAGGLADRAPCQGTLDLLYFSQAKIRYSFDFRDDGGRDLHFVGEKINIRPWNLHRTHTTCYGIISTLPGGEEISTSTTYFRLRTVPAFVASLRLA